ncbi:hypothetical protein ACWT_3873 [Actinoplanes sp. SE50]|uniref:hypothetical protein n=1 Tax=unclassified Actinoplanes TaxID=2626549 RepID=UPI00023ECEC1|nr:MULTISPECIES: hypothetical protein [unclassified Actinoplanes]AEV84897.1 hypothetical protein ACPL_4002 [Actinoplanes sp. SE50/110]ATO83288.1 hypothetical protein ACWT_3873 [Actinoplanes sp. SE50]SLM00695.1 hypothetical protein ACSP50_3928 [Actinoplanes sp. SE50/110]
MTRPRIRLTHKTEEATAAGIYGIIVGAAVLVTAHGVAAWREVLAVLATLTVYWVAERYARIVAERIHEGHRPTWHVVREHLTSGWELVTASLLPLLVLITIRASGAALLNAEIISLSCSTLLLCLAGWSIGSGGRLTYLERIVSTMVAGAFGVSMVVLKALLH